MTYKVSLCTKISDIEITKAGSLRRLKRSNAMNHL